MTPTRVALVGLAIVAVLAWLTGWLGWIGFGALVIAVMFLNARDWTIAGPPRVDESSQAPRIAPYAEPIDIGEELVDLMWSAAQRSTRILEDRGRLGPFVMYEDAEGNVRVRPVATADGDGALGRAREVARSIDVSAPRVVLAVPDVVELAGRRSKVVRYEGAEHGFRERTYAFVQPIRARRLIFPATTEGPLIYIGDGEHTLRFSAAG